jgi:hypothetical protein
MKHCHTIALVVLLAAPFIPAADGQAMTPMSEQELSAIFDRPVMGIEQPLDSDAIAITNALTPALAFRSKTGRMRLFARMGDYGLEAPTYMAWVSDGGVKISGRGQVGELAESWLLLWFSGSAAFRNLRYTDFAKQQLDHYRLKNGPVAFDVPFLICLQNRPTSVSLGAAGLEMTFAGDSGVVQAMPLMGVHRPSPDLTATWTKGLPADVLARCRAWNARLKFYPAQAVERYEVDASAGTMSLIHDYRFVELPDAWKTQGEPAAPIPPAIALAAAHGMKMNFSAKPVDTGCPTQWGPGWVVPGQRSVSIAVPFLMELISKLPVPSVNPASDADLLAKIDESSRQQADQSGMGWWAAAGCATAQGNKAALLPYCSKETATIVKAATMRLMNNNVFSGVNTVDRLVDEQRGRTYLVDYVNQHQRYADDNEAPSSQILRGSFNYAFYTGDWTTIGNHWTMLQQAAVASYIKNNWTIQGRFNSGGDTFHDVIAGTAAMARMAGALGKEEDFGLFCYLFARHMICYHGFEHSLKLHALENQPWFIPIQDTDVVVWDIYAPFGGKFSPLNADGYYGKNSGFYEHYFRIDRDIFPRFYRTVLPKHTQAWFGEKAVNMVADPDPNEAEKWRFLFDMRAYLLAYDYDRLKQWYDAKDNWQAGKTAPEILAAFYDARHPRSMVDVVAPSLRRPIKGIGIHLQANGFRNNAIGMETRTRGEPGLWWWGWNGPDAPSKVDLHGGNLMSFGHFEVADGKPVGRVTEQPNWVVESYRFNIASPNAEQRAAAEAQARAAWMICGPFGDARKKGEDFNDAFPPEQEQERDFGRTYAAALLKPDKASPDPVKVTARWALRTMHDQEDGKELPPNVLTCRWGFDHAGCTYLFTRVWVPEATKARCSISSFGRQRVWINGALVFDNPKGFRAIKADASVFDAQLKPGWNDVLAKIRNVEFWEKFYFRVMDANELSIPMLKFDPNGK